ncbi:MAG: aminotransferase class V-fold PLP-dependent enzyme [Alphaproteobacteria bacterium]|nr:aminotransferase class V-fold PLP-dependent enzyme [Alphaproteobacteria bacterium]
MNKIIYLDAAASALKPDAVVDAEVDFLRHKYANAGRGICARAAAVDQMVGRARMAVADFIGGGAHQIVFTSGTTDAMNRIVNIVRQLPVFSARRPVVGVSDLDHHSARMPWQHLANGGVCDIAVCPLDADFNIDVAQLPVADVLVITAMSNVMGVGQDVAAIVAAARQKNPDVITIVDAAQYVAHAPIDVAQWGCDFLCFSGHKIGMDTGIGVMYIKNPDAMPADKFGGGMVNKILADGTWTLNAAPEKFEAGTLPLTQIAGLVPAIDAWRAWGGAHEQIGVLYDALKQMPRIKILTPRDASLISFVVDGMHVLDFGAHAGVRNLCLRVGNMCATWIHRALGVDGSIRISVGPWNTMDDIHAAVRLIGEIVK